jgi:hypothetical protein
MASSADQSTLNTINNSLVAPGNVNSPLVAQPKTLSLTPTPIPSSATSGIKIAPSTIQVPTPGISGATQTAPNPLFTPHAAITTAPTPVAGNYVSGKNPGAITINSAAQMNPAKATPTPTVPATNVGQTNTLTIPTSNAPTVTATTSNNLGTAVNQVNNGSVNNPVTYKDANGNTVNSNGIPVDSNGNNITNGNNQSMDQYGNSVGTTYNQDGTVASSPTGNSVLGVQTGSPTRTGVLGYIQQLMGQEAQKGPASEAAYESGGIYDKMNQANQINNQILSTQRSYNEQAKTIKNNHNGLDVAGVQEQLNTLSRQQNEDMANLSIIKSANDNDLTTAQSIIDKKLAFQFDPIQQEITNLGSFLQLNNSDLSDSQKQAISVKQYQLQNNLDLLKGAKQTAQQYAIQQGITDPKILGAIDAATTPAEAYNALSGSGGITSASQTPNGGIVSGYNLSSYATDPTKPMQVQNIVNTIQQNNATSSPQALNQYIQSVAPNSPITGQQILDAATKYGVDPNVLAANVQQESGFGTLGIGAKTNNAGNIGNTDNGSTKTYDSWQAGLDANAKWLSDHKATTANGVTIPSQLQGVPAVIPQGIKGVPGTAYVDAGRLTGTPIQQNKITQAATTAHIPVLSDSDVSKVRSIDITKQNLDAMQGAISGLLGNGAVGRIGSSISNLFGQVTQSNETVASWNGYRTLAVNALQALGAGSGGARITAGEIQTATDNLPTITDSAQTANKKIAIINGFLNNWTKEILPNAQTGGSSSSQTSGTTPSGISYTISG